MPFTKACLVVANLLSDSNYSWTELLQVDEMEKAVDVAESNMARFGLTHQEVASRKKWVNKTRQQARELQSHEI